jgi:23S rRNA (uracil1939-C5)-methyltransferase
VADVTAIEGDPFSAEDLDRNASRLGQRIRVVHGAVEDVVRNARGRDETTIIVDPPRTGMSRAALDGVLGWRAPQVIYVSCDVATAARDARRFVDAGYRASSVEVFDMFPNTPHVETLVRFTRG